MKEFIKKYYIRFIIMVLGTLLIGVSAAFYVISNIGANAINTFNLGISALLSKIFNREVPSSVGIIIGNSFFSLLLLIFARKYLNLGTALSILLVGPICQLVLALNIFEVSDKMFICIIYCLVATILTGIGVALIIEAKLGTSPFDGFSLFLNDHIKINYSIIRIIFDALLFLSGFLMGEVVGIGSIISIALTGPMIFVFKKLFDLLKPNKDNPESKEISENNK